MKHTPFFVIACLILFSATATQAQLKQKLDIETATVFLKGAELGNTAKMSLSKGENEVIFTNVAGNINTQSLTVGATNGIVVESATFQNNYLTAAVISPRAKELRDSISLITDEKDELNNKIAVIAEQIAILQENKKVSGNANGLNVAELTKMLDLASAKWDSYLTQKAKLNKTLKKTDELLTGLNKQLEEEQKKDHQPGGQLLVKFYAKEATNTTITIDYVVPNAGWTATYDIMADDVNSPVKLFYKANIYQNSGVNWNNVHLSLSTGNPNEGAQAPTMNSWYLSFYTPSPVAYQKAINGAAPGVYQQQRGEDVSIGGGRSSGMLYIVDGVQVQNTSIDNYVSVDNSGVNTNFDIDLPYTIPTDGQQHLVAIKKYELPATYRYYVVPKLDKDAFLQAQVTKWEDLNLLPGQSNIFYEGTYVGQGYIDVRNVKDTMNISLGRDKKIVVKREQDTKLRSVKTIGSNVRETSAYTISIRNTRKEAINLIVQDQQPVSNDKDIVIEDKETGGAVYDEQTGMMNWTISVNPNETKQLSFGYTVKYPKGKTVNGLR